jgi:AraC family transcriptional regulator
MRIDAPAQLLAALVRHRLARGMTETLEAEDLILLHHLVGNGPTAHE